jgi:hypothetical protein
VRLASRTVRRSLLRAALLAAAALAASCGGGGGGGGTGPTSPPPPPTPGITFTSSGSAAAPGISLATGAGSTANDLILEVRASGIHDLYGIAFDLQYPGGVLQFATSNSSGSILAGGTFQLSHTTTDILVGASRLGTVSGVAGDGVILALEFQPAAAGNGAFSFTRNAVFDSAGAPIAGVSWSAGTVQVVR